jgi:hypothetical protein
MNDLDDILRDTSTGQRERESFSCQRRLGAWFEEDRISRNQGRENGVDRHQVGEAGTDEPCILLLIERKNILPGSYYKDDTQWGAFDVSLESWLVGVGERNVCQSRSCNR